MIDYLRDIKPLQDQGVTNAVIAQHLSARTGQAMSTESSRETLQESGAVLTDPVMISQRSGGLIDYYQTLQAGTDQTLIAWFLSEVFNESSTSIGTNEYPRSLEFAQVEASLPDDIKLVAETLVNQSGGRPDAGCTEAEVISYQSSYEQQQIINQEMQALEERYMEQYNLNIAPLINSQVTDENQWQSALQKMADDFIPAE